MLNRWAARSRTYLGPDPRLSPHRQPATLPVAGCCMPGVCDAAPPHDGTPPPPGEAWCPVRLWVMELGRCLRLPDAVRAVLTNGELLPGGRPHPIRLLSCRVCPTPPGTGPAHADAELRAAPRPRLELDPARVGRPTIDGAAVNVCPQAGACVKVCYARNGTFNFPAVKAAHVRNLERVTGDLSGVDDRACSTSCPGGGSARPRCPGCRTCPVATCRVRSLTCSTPVRPLCASTTPATSSPTSTCSRGSRSRP